MIPKYKELPQDIAAEGALIGSMILDPDCVPHVIEYVKEDDFVLPEAAMIFGQIVDLWRKQIKYDGVIIRSFWMNLSQNRQEQLFQFLVKALNGVPSAVNALYYARLVYRKSVERKLMTLVEAAANQMSEIHTIEEKIEIIRTISAAVPHLDKQQLNTEIASLITQHLSNLEDEGGLTTGLTSLDRMAEGFKKGDFILLAARPSMGKSSLALDFFIHLSRVGAKPYFYSLEMAADRIIKRMLRNIARYKHTYYNKSAPEIIEAAEIVKKWPAWIEQKINYKIEEICFEILAQSQKNKIGICFIDYLQLIHADGKSRYEQVTYISSQLKELAQTAHIPIVALSQLNRACELRTNHRPIMSDLRDSGSIEQDADLIMFLHRDDYYRQKIDPQTKLDYQAQLIIAKNKEGKTGDINLIWLPECTSFSEMNPNQDDFGLPF